MFPGPAGALLQLGLDGLGVGYVWHPQMLLSTDVKPTDNADPW